MKRRTTKTNPASEVATALDISPPDLRSSEQEPLHFEPSSIPLIELSYINQVKAADRTVVRTSVIAYKLLLETWDKKMIEMQEQFKVLLLNKNNHALGLYELSKGGVTGTVVDPKLVFAAAIKAHASSIILAHNHPSTNLIPSRADKLLTSKIKQAGELLDIDVLDHIIVTNYGFYSFADEGLV